MYFHMLLSPHAQVPGCQRSIPLPHSLYEYDVTLTYSHRRNFDAIDGSSTFGHLADGCIRSLREASTKRPKHALANAITAGYILHQESALDPSETQIVIHRRDKHYKTWTCKTRAGIGHRVSATGIIERRLSGSQPLA